MPPMARLLNRLRNVRLRTVAITLAIGTFIRRRIFRRRHRVRRERDENREEVPLAERPRIFRKKRSDTPASTSKGASKRDRKLRRAKARAFGPPEEDDDTTAEPPSLTERSEGTQQSRTISSSAFQDCPSLDSIDADPDFNLYATSTDHSLLTSPQSSKDYDHKSTTTSTQNLSLLGSSSMCQLDTERLYYFSDDDKICNTSTSMPKLIHSFSNVDLSDENSTVENTNQSLSSSNVAATHPSTSGLRLTITTVDYFDENITRVVSTHVPTAGTSEDVSSIPKPLEQVTDKSPPENKDERFMISPGDYVYTPTSPPSNIHLNYLRNILAQQADASTSRIEESSSTESSSRDQVVGSTDSSSRDQVVPQQRPPVKKSTKNKKNKKILGKK